jgi:hypothetical protein
MYVIPQTPRASGELSPPGPPTRALPSTRWGHKSGPQTPRLPTNPGSAPDIHFVSVSRSCICVSVYIHFVSVSRSCICVSVYRLCLCFSFVYLCVSVSNLPLFLVRVFVCQCISTLSLFLVRVFVCQCIHFASVSRSCICVSVYIQRRILEGACGACAPPPKIRKAYVMQR